MFEQCSNGVRTVFERCSVFAHTHTHAHALAHTHVHVHVHVHTYTHTIDATNLSVGKSTPLRHYVNVVDFRAFFGFIYDIICLLIFEDEAIRRPTAKHAVTTPNFRA